MINIEEGGEYEGERYIRCTSHSPWAVFKGRSVGELMDFLTEHDHDHEIWPMTASRSLVPVTTSTVPS